MSALLLRNSAKEAILKHYQDIQRIVESDTGAMPEGVLRTRLGEMHGLQQAIGILDTKFSEQNSR